MSLQSAKSKLTSEIKKALTEQKNAGAKDGASPQSIVSDYSKTVADAIKAYIESATVVGSATVPPRIGPTPTFGVGNAAGGPEVFSNGKVSFTTNSALKSALDSAQNKSKDEGAKDGASPDSIISTLAKEITEGIHSFATTAMVTIDLPTTPGKPVIGFMMLTSPSPVPPPIPATTMGTVGKGVGNLS